MTYDLAEEELTRRVSATFLAAFREADMSVQMWAILACVAEQPSLSVKDIAARLCITKASVSVGVDGLVQAGLVKRDEDPADRRRVRIVLTVAGEDLLRRLDGRELQLPSASQS